MMEAVLSNADHPEYGVATIPLPIPRNQYDHCVALLEALEIGEYLDEGTLPFGEDEIKAFIDENCQ